MTSQDLEFLQTLLVSRAGFLLTRERRYLVENRLAPLARREGFLSVDRLIEALRDKPVGALGWETIEAMLTPETWFNRDRAPFSILRDEVLPALANARPGGSVRIWSAGCSTGQEAYSLAMGALETGVTAEIVATDLSRRFLEKAQSGLYTQFEIQRGLSAHRLLQWFEKVDDMWCARPELRAAVQFERANLMDPPQAEGAFDVIFCRNVLTELEPSRARRLLHHLSKALADDGCLFLGATETAGAEPDVFRAVAGRQGLFVKAPGSVRRAA